MLNGGKMAAESDHELDVKGLQCPLPVLKASKRLKSIKYGETLKIFATDPASEIDFAHYCNESGNELVWQNSDAGVFTFVIRKSNG